MTTDDKDIDPDRLIEAFGGTSPRFNRRQMDAFFDVAARHQGFLNFVCDHAHDMSADELRTKARDLRAQCDEVITASNEPPA